MTGWLSIFKETLLHEQLSVRHSLTSSLISDEPHQLIFLYNPSTTRVPFFDNLAPYPIGPSTAGGIYGAWECWLEGWDRKEDD